MSPKYHAMAASLLLAACTTARPAVVATAPAGDDALICAGDLLAAQGYEVRQGKGAEATLEGEVRLNHAPMGATREIITTSVDGSATPAALTVVAGAWEYRPAEHNLPVARQSVTEIRPSDRLVADARLIVETCGTGVRADRR